MATKKSTKKAAPDATMALAQLAEKYVEHLETQGKSAGTVWSYANELKLAMKEIGADKPIASITRDDVTAFYNCARVTLLKSGKPKSQLSIDKTRRVLRMALVWAQGQGWIEAAPLPKTEATEPDEAPAPKATKKRARKAALEVPQPAAEAVADAIEPEITGQPAA